MEKLTVIIPSFKRERNVQRIADSILQCEEVDKLIISNNNSSIDINDWLKLEDARVVIINQSEDKGCAWRWELAKGDGAEYFIAVDDDVFISPEQVHKLLGHLVAEPECPHGMFGSHWNIEEQPPHKIKKHYYWVHEGSVDLIHQVYAVTRRHVERFYQLREELGKSNPELADYIDFSDDMLMSHCGDKQAKSHDFGFIEECETKNADGIACCRDPQFADKREALYRALTPLREKLKL